MNLGAPQKTVLVNIVKATLGVAVVQQFKELCRFNIRRWACEGGARWLCAEVHGGQLGGQHHCCVILSVDLPGGPCPAPTERGP